MWSHARRSYGACAVVAVAMVVLSSPLRAFVRGRAYDGTNDDNVRDKRIIGGHKYNRGKWPWLISLTGTRVTAAFLGVAVAQQSLFCGGSLISKRWVLTAAHCFSSDTTNPISWDAILGENSAKASRTLCSLVGSLLGIDNWKVWRVPVVKIIIHPGYNEADTWHNDVALLKLKNAVPDSMSHIPRIRKVALPYQGDDSFPEVGQICYMKGWGCDKNGGPTLDVAHELVMPIISNYACERTFVRGMRWTTRLCAGHNNTMQGICRGDSGGPLVCRRHNKWVQVGIASFSTHKDPGKVPGVFTRVSAYIEWIKETISAN